MGAIPLLNFPEFCKDRVYILEGSIGLISNLKSYRQNGIIYASLDDSQSTKSQWPRKMNVTNYYLGSSKNNLPRDKNKQHNLRLFHSVDQSRKQFWLILNQQKRHVINTMNLVSTSTTTKHFSQDQGFPPRKQLKNWKKQKGITQHYIEKKGKALLITPIQECTQNLIESRISIEKSVDKNSKLHYTTNRAQNSWDRLKFLW